MGIGSACNTGCNPDWANMNPHNSPLLNLPSKKSLDEGSLYVDITYDEAILINGMSGLITHSPQLLQLLREVLRTKDIDMDITYRHFIEKFAHYIHEFGWCPDPNCEDKSHD